VTNCVITANSTGAQGGGTFGGTLYHCTLAANSAGGLGGGAYGDPGRASPVALYGCIINGNSAQSGGGAYEATLENCLLTGNSAIFGGGAHYSYLIGCSVVGNTATQRAGGIYIGSLTNTIVYYNTAPDGSNWAGYIYPPPAAFAAPSRLSPAPATSPTNRAS